MKKIQSIREQTILFEIIFYGCIYIEIVRFIFSLTFGALLSDYSLLDIISPPIENISLPFLSSLFSSLSLIAFCSRSLLLSFVHLLFCLFSHFKHRSNRQRRLLSICRNRRVRQKNSLSQFHGYSLQFFFSFYFVRFFSEIIRSNSP